MRRVHELSICQALLKQVADIVVKHDSAVVARITIEVGPLAGVDPLLLSAAFSSLRAGSCARRAELVIESTEVTIRCISCGAESQTQPNRLVCGVCGAFRIHVLSGEELRLRRVELEASVPQPAHAA
jgi:hydrogenase nickel incorporation protein HypA/HybF